MLFKYWSFLHSLALRHFKSVQNDWPGVSCLYPRGQSEQLVLRCFSVNCPAWQFLQRPNEPRSPYLPLSQSWHSIEPLKDVSPGGQTVQLSIAGYVPFQPWGHATKPLHDSSPSTQGEMYDPLGTSNGAVPSPKTMKPVSDLLQKDDPAFP